MKFRRQLFKYLDVSGAEAMLSRGTLQFTNSLYYNDPFDCHPSLMDFSGCPPGRNGSILKDWIRKDQESRHARLRERTWICSLSKINDSILMWSHYADNHKGVCVELNMAHAVIDLGNKTYGNIIHNLGLDVHYKDLIGKPDYFKDNINYLEYQITTKGKDWEYEQERRLYIIDPSPQHMAFPFKPDKNKTYDWKILRVYPRLRGESFEAVYLGAKMSDEDKQKIIHAAKKINKNIKIYQMNINPAAFKLDAAEVVQDA